MSATDPLDLDAIEARANAATSGPWSITTEGLTHPVGFDIRSDTNAWPHHEVASDGEGYQGCIASAYNAEFIAHARTDVPALVARVRELEPRVLKGDWETVRDALDALAEGAQIRWRTNVPTNTALAIKIVNVLGKTRWSSTDNIGYVDSENVARDGTPIEVLA